MADLRIFSYLPNPRLAKATIAARFSGAEIEIIGDDPPKLGDWLWDFEARPLSDAEKESLAVYRREAATGFSGALYKTDEFLKLHPFGSVPAGFSGDGRVGIFESNAIMRAAAKSGPNAPILLGNGVMEECRVESFLDRALIFARDSQQYLLSGGNLSADAHGRMAGSLTSFAEGLDRALRTSAYIACDEVTLADVAVACELCLLTAERRFAKNLEAQGLALLAPYLAPYDRLGEHISHLAGDHRFNEDLGRYFKHLLPVWE